MIEYTYGRAVFDASQGIAKATVEAYEYLTEAAGQHIVHIRNFVPNILASEGDSGNVYQEFCAARKQVFDRHGVTEYPSACAVGGDDMLELIYITSNEKPTRLTSAVQIDPAKYPESYGTPLFSRASIVGDDLFVSGTASIVGHKTIHAGNIEAQTRTTISAVSQIIAAAEKATDDLIFTAYVKHKHHTDTVGKILAEHGITPIFRHTDICRDDLLVEIEALPRRFK